MSLMSSFYFSEQGMYENYNTNMEIPNQWSDNHMMAHPNQMHWREFTPEANNAPLEYKTNFDHIDPSKDVRVILFLSAIMV